MTNFWREQARKAAKKIRLRGRNLIYQCITKHCQFGSPSGHAPRRFADNVAAFVATNAAIAAWIPVLPPEILRQPVPRGSPTIEKHFQKYLPIQLPQEGVLRLTSARILGGYAGAIISADDTLIKPFAIDPFGMERHRSSVRLRLPKIQKLSGITAFLATPEANHNYYHFTIDLLPRLLLLEKAVGSLGCVDHFVLNLGGGEYEMELLGCFGVPQDKIICLDQETHLQAEELLAPTWTDSEYGVANWKTNGIQAKVSGSATAIFPEKRLFLSRKKAAIRRLLNEDAVAEALKSLGFIAIDCGNLSLKEQVSLFQSATHVVGLHGAALTNLVYCQPGTRVFEIINESVLRGFFWSLSCAKELKHHFTPVKSAQPVSHLEIHRANRLDLTVDIPKLIAEIQSSGLQHS